MMLLTLHAALIALPPTGEVRAYRSASPLCGPLGACAHEYRPRCGSDGITYANLCLARNACQGDATEGPCRTASAPQDLAILVGKPALAPVDSVDEAMGRGAMVSTYFPGRYVSGSDPQNWRKLDEWLAGVVTIAGEGVRKGTIASVLLVTGVVLLGWVAALHMRAAHRAVSTEMNTLLLRLDSSGRGLDPDDLREKRSCSAPTIRSPSKGTGGFRASGAAEEML